MKRIVGPDWMPAHCIQGIFATQIEDERHPLALTSLPVLDDAGPEKLRERALFKALL
jgi:hypothetical protein